MQKLLRTLIICLASLLMCHFMILKGLHPVLSSALVGFLFSHLTFLSTHLRATAYCASFAAIGLEGLTSHTLVFKVVLVSFFVSSLMTLLERRFVGFGGKLGTIAFVGTGLTLILLGVV